MKSLFDIFQELGIEYKLFDHPPFFTCEESQGWYEQNLDKKSGESKNLFLRDKKGGKHLLLVVESHKKPDLKKFSEKIGEKKLSLASPERLEKYLGVFPGSVSIFALIHENAKSVSVFVDTDLLKYKQLHFHPPARNDQTVLLDTTDAKKFLDWTGNKVQFITL